MLWRRRCRYETAVLRSIWEASLFRLYFFTMDSNEDEDTIFLEAEEVVSEDPTLLDSRATPDDVVEANELTLMEIDDDLVEAARNDTSRNSRA